VIFCDGGDFRQALRNQLVTDRDDFLSLLARWPRSVEAGPFFFFGGTVAV